MIVREENDMKKSMQSWMLIAFFAFGVVFWMVLWFVVPPGEKPEELKVNVQNISPCLEPNWKRVEKLTEGQPQWICADIKTDKPSINLDLKIFNREDGNYIYSDDAPFSSGSIAWIIYPPLPPGEYGARITGFRGPTFASFEFEVVETSNK
jgi:hypothetical protein